MGFGWSAAMADALPQLHAEAAARHSWATKSEQMAEAASTWQFQKPPVQSLQSVGCEVHTLQ